VLLRSTVFVNSENIKASEYKTKWRLVSLNNSAAAVPEAKSKSEIQKICQNFYHQIFKNMFQFSNANFRDNCTKSRSDLTKILGHFYTHTAYTHI